MLISFWNKKIKLNFFKKISVLEIIFDEILDRKEKKWEQK
jgi:hypothetical protein